MWLALLNEIFPKSDKSWTWRRRMAFAACAVFLWGIVYSIGFEPDATRADKTLFQCIGGLIAVMGIYFHDSFKDTQLKRGPDQGVAQ
jgi:hypothetical protein